MIKLVLPEDKPPEPERTVHFEFRRHKQSETNKPAEHLVYLIGRDPDNSSAINLYPIKIDGIAKTVEIRRRFFEMLGFTVVVKD